MRLALAVAFGTVLGGCLEPQYPDPPPSPEPDPGWTGPTGDPVSGCDATCGSQVCARDGRCYPASSIHEGRVQWTVRGAHASVEACGTTPDLLLRFWGPNGDEFGFAPVPCKNGLFTVDKLPTLYDRAELGPESALDGTTALFDRTTFVATINLP